MYRTQLPVVEQALETAARMLGSDRSRGYCLEMICADFLAGANLDNGDPEILLSSLRRFFTFLPDEHQRRFLRDLPMYGESSAKTPKSETGTRRVPGAASAGPAA